MTVGFMKSRQSMFPTGRKLARIGNAFLTVRNGFILLKNPTVENNNFVGRKLL